MLALAIVYKVIEMRPTPPLILALGEWGNIL